jgi:transposase
MKKRYVVKLTPEEREQLEHIVNRGREAAYRRRHAQVLLWVDEGEQGPKLYDKEAAERTGFTRRTVEQIRERCVIEGLTAALARKPRRDRGKRKLDGEAEARLLSIACSHPSTGRARWTLQLLADQLVTLNIVDTLSHESVRQVLKKRHQTLAKADVVYSA